MLPTIAIERGDADERGDRAPIEAAEFRQFRQQRARDGRADARHGPQQVLLDAPDRTLLNGAADLVVDVAHAPLEPANMIAQIARNGPVGGACSSRRRSAPSISSNCRRRATKAASAWVSASAIGRAGGWTRAPKSASTVGIDRVGLRRAAQRLGKRAHLARIDDRHRQPGRGARRPPRSSYPPVASSTITSGRCARSRSRGRRAPSASWRSSTSRRWDAPRSPGRFAHIDPDALTRLHDLAPGHRGSRPYARTGSRPGQLFGINDDGYGRAPRLSTVLRPGDNRATFLDDLYQIVKT